ncbi:MAG: glycine C-acetyltransferase [Bacteroidetes bacterium]|nr:glycine C-acetyltransferase [Bacteroidota bacterium]MBU1422716.1 glycine C-acetyltransferase [Bacteroidota bacterium]MBU2470906.1 glycine C-acetyltransferase [Bacteroidota bacterium]MBU2635504.1 glycine C-acetyltransferase [Bacteroidota bacterium]
MDIITIIKKELKRLEESNTCKHETPLQSPQGGVVKVKGKDVVMLASNNYLGLSDHPAIKKAAIEGIKKYGYGIASVRFICGTQDIHLQLENKISKFVGTEDTILFSSCFAANEGFFASLTNEKLGFENYKDVLYSDKLNHASIIDGQRLCKSETTDKKIYNHADMTELERLLEEDKNKDYRFKMIVTDGVFSMEGNLAPLDKIVELGKKYNTLVFVDDSHAIGVSGKTGRGTPEAKGVFGKIDVLTGTLGKAMGGAAGGYISGKKELITYLRQKSRPYTFSNSLPPAIIYGAMAAFDLLTKDHSIVQHLHDNTKYFRKEIKALGFTILEGDHPIVPIMLGEASVAQDMSAALLKAGVYIKGLWFPVVPKGEARLRTQISAALTKKDIDHALDAFEKVGKRMKVI